MYLFLTFFPIVIYKFVKKKKKKFNLFLLKVLAKRNLGIILGFLEQPLKTPEVKQSSGET